MGKNLERSYKVGGHRTLKVLVEMMQEHSKNTERSMQVSGKKTGQIFTAGK